MELAKRRQVLVLEGEDDEERDGLDFDAQPKLRSAMNTPYDRPVEFSKLHKICAALRREHYQVVEEDHEMEDQD